MIRNCPPVLLAFVAIAATPAWGQFARPPSVAELQKASAAQTPRDSLKHPDLSGYWATPLEFGSGETKRSEDGKSIEFQIKPPADLLREREAGQGRGAEGRGTPSNLLPPYRAELAGKVRELVATQTDSDPSFRCLPPGTPRAGIPTEIFQGRDAVVFLYETRSNYRVIPIGSVAHDPNLDPSWYGDSVAHWEGDTLVIDVVNLTDESWMANGGYFHSDALHVVERFTRQGNTLRYEVRAEDPKVLTGPWIIPARTAVLGKPGVHAAEDAPCIEKDREHMVDKSHSTP